MIEMLWKDEEASSSCEETNQHSRVEAVMYRGMGKDSSKSMSRTVQQLAETFSCLVAVIAAQGVDIRS